MIVKIQASQFTTEPTRTVLIYNRARDHVYQGELTAEHERILAGRPKAFFHARMRGTTLEINEEAPWQDW